MDALTEPVNVVTLRGEPAGNLGRCAEIMEPWNAARIVPIKKRLKNQGFGAKKRKFKISVFGKFAQLRYNFRPKRLKISLPFLV